MLFLVSVCKKHKANMVLKKVILWHCINLNSLGLFTTWLLVDDFSWPARNVPILSHRTESACYSITVTPL